MGHLEAFGDTSFGDRSGAKLNTVKSSDHVDGTIRRLRIHWVRFYGRPHIALVSLKLANRELVLVYAVEVA